MRLKKIIKHIFIVALVLTAVLTFSSCGENKDAQNTFAGYFFALNNLDFNSAQEFLNEEGLYDELISDMSSPDEITRLNAECFAKAVYQNLDAEIVEITPSENGFTIKAKIKSVDVELLTNAAYEFILNYVNEEEFGLQSSEEKYMSLAEIFESAYENAYSLLQTKEALVTLELTYTEDKILKINPTKELFDAISGKEISNA